MDKETQAEIERTRDLASEQQARLHAEVMRDANLALTCDLSLERFLDTLLNYLHKLVPYDSANVMLADGDSRFVVSALKDTKVFWRIRICHGAMLSRPPRTPLSSGSAPRLKAC